MTILVTPHADGTYTVTCGGEAVTIGGSPGAARPTPVVFPTDTGAVTAAIRSPFAPDDIVDLPVSNADEIVAAIARHRPRRRWGETAAPSLLRVRWLNAEPLDTASISTALRDHGDSDLRVEITASRGRHD